MAQVINPKRALYIGGLEESVSEELLRAAFIPFGDLVLVNLPIDQNTQKSWVCICGI